MAPDGRKPADAEGPRVNAFLAPLEIDERGDELGTAPSVPDKCSSDKSFLGLPFAGYLALLDSTARQLVPGKGGATPRDAPPIFSD